MRTVWVLGDQLNREFAGLKDASPEDTRILLVESAAKCAGKRWHRQRLHLVLTAMRRFAGELRDAGFDVDLRQAPTLAAGFEAHRQEHGPDEVCAMEPASWDGVALMKDLDVSLLRSDQFLCHYEEFADWAGAQKRLRMEDFYRWQRKRLRVLMDGDEPAGGRWNYDDENREPPPGAEVSWPEPSTSRLDDLDREVIADLPSGVFGAEPCGLWATSRRAALARLRHFCENVLPGFGPHEDAMTERSWHLAHSLLSPYLNLGLLRPLEVVEAAEAVYRAGDAPIASVEGFVRQVIGWREYVWGVYWLWMPDYREQNHLGAKRPLPPLFHDPTATEMRCARHALETVEAHGYAHHIQRLMVLGNLGLLAGVRPHDLVEWMWASFVDGAEWVMLPNVLSMALYADGGRMTTKPYAAGGAYLNRMSDHCGECAFNPRKRIGDDACPFTTLYWDFIARNRKALERNHRMARQVKSLDRLKDVDEVRARARQVLRRLDDGAL